MEGAGPARPRVCQDGPEKPAAMGMPMLQLGPSPELPACGALSLVEDLERWWYSGSAERAHRVPCNVCLLGSFHDVS